MNSNVNWWNVTVKNVTKFNTPSFIRLFMINRIMRQDAYDHSRSYHDQINELIPTTEAKNDNKKQMAKSILIDLLKHGIKHYMKIIYQEKQQSHIIELIFNTIICKRFSKQIDSMTRYVNNNKSNNCNDTCNYYQSMVFNTQDLMTSIFQYLKYKSCTKKKGLIGDLLNCSLVCTHWLYHVWNPNSIHFAYLTDMITLTIALCDHDERCEEDKVYKSTVIRMWQRFYNAKYIVCAFNYNFDICAMDDIHLDNMNFANSILIDKFSIFKNIIKIDLIMNVYQELYMTILKILMQNCKTNIQHCCIQINLKGKQSSEQNKINDNNINDSDANTPVVTLPMLKLAKLKCLHVYHLPFNIEWSNKCQSLYLFAISNEWCNFVINHCDCTGVQKLVLNNSIKVFNKTSIINKSLLAKCAQKFKNLKHLEMIGHQKPDIMIKGHSIKVLLFEYLMDNIDSNINNNQCKVILDINSYYNGEMLSQAINKHNKLNKHFTIHQIIVHSFSNIIQELEVDEKTSTGENSSDNSSDHGHLKSIILNCNVEYLSFIDLGNNKAVLQAIVKFLKNYSLNYDNINNYDCNSNEQSKQVCSQLQGNKSQLSSLQVVKCNIDSDRHNYDSSFTGNNFGESFMFFDSSSHYFSDVEFINQFLELDIFSKKNCFLIGIFSLNSIDMTLGNNRFQFEYLFKNIFLLMFKECAPVDIQITLSNINKHRFEKCYHTMYLPCFDQSIISNQYKMPRCNKYCQALELPRLSFVFSNSKQEAVMHLTNVHPCDW